MSSPWPEEPYSRGAWRFILGPATGGWKWELPNAKGRRCKFSLRSPSDASFTIDGNDPLAKYIDELSTDLHILREDDKGGIDQLFRGRITSTTDELGESGHVMAVPALDYRSVLERRHLMSGSQISWTGQEQYAIMNGLLQQAQMRPNGDYGIEPIAGASGVVRDRNYELGDSIGQRMQELSEVENGFDWDIIPDGPSAMKLTAFSPNRGQDRGVILEYGGLVKSLTRSVDSADYANHVRVTGQPAEGSSTPPPPHEGIATDIATAPQGRWDKVIGTTIVLTSTLAERRTWLLDHHQVIRPAYTIRLRRNAWKGPNHIWLGDPVRLRINSGRLAVDTVLRVHELDVDITNGGNEDVVLALAGPRPDYRRRSAAIERRLEMLERR